MHAQCKSGTSENKPTHLDVMFQWMSERSSLWFKILLTMWLICATCEFTCGFVCNLRFHFLYFLLVASFQICGSLFWNLDLSTKGNVIWLFMVVRVTILLYCCFSVSVTRLFIRLWFCFQFFVFVSCGVINMIGLKIGCWIGKFYTR